MTGLFALAGPAGDVPVGFVRVPAGQHVVRCHRPGRADLDATLASMGIGLLD